MTWQLSEGDWCHVEIPTKDPQRARRFYEEVFGWKFFEIPGFDIQEIVTSEDGIRSTLGSLAQDQDIVSFLLVKGSVEDMKRKAEAVEAAGGSVVKPPTEIPGVGAFAYVADPEGHIFGFWQDAQAQEGAGTPS